ncbi:MAG: hypothetical protein OEQ39_27050 [Gammaproteobacteria bacterium]|nr:hypothetical protein [Gammaproteobacteria bacterium]
MASYFRPTTPYDGVSGEGTWRIGTSRITQKGGRSNRSTVRRILGAIRYRYCSERPGMGPGTWGVHACLKGLAERRENPIVHQLDHVAMAG